MEAGTSLGSNENALSQGAARAAGVGRADLVALGRLDALRARAPLRTARHDGAGRLARRAPTSPTSTSSCCPRATTPARSAMPCSAASRTGCAPAARWSRWPKPRAGRRAAMSACWTRTRCSRTASPTCRRRPGGRGVGCVCERACRASLGGSGPGQAASGGRSSGSGRPVQDSETEPRPSITTRRFSPIASGPTRSPARSCTSRSTPTTG